MENKTLFFIGIILAIIPFTGFPMFWKDFFIVSVGLVLVLKSVFRFLFLHSKEILEKEELKDGDNLNFEEGETAQ